MQNFRESSPKTTSNGGRGKKTSLLKSSQVKSIAEKLAKNVADENNNGGTENNVEMRGTNQISRPAVDLISSAHSNLNLPKKSDEGKEEVKEAVRASLAKKDNQNFVKVSKKKLEFFVLTKMIDNQFVELKI